jgi:hypothetical protein
LIGVYERTFLVIVVEHIIKLMMIIFKRPFSGSYRRKELAIYIKLGKISLQKKDYNSNLI